MIEQIKTILERQFAATLAMLGECIERCPDEHWTGVVGKYPFWQVAYHTLCYADLYLSPSETDFTLRPIHPQGWDELKNEYPSRLFNKAELLEYVDFCQRKAAEIIAAQTSASFSEPSGFSWQPVTRGELHICNIRHVQHHTGQLSAFLRRVDVDTSWIKSGGA